MHVMDYTKISLFYLETSLICESYKQYIHIHTYTHVHAYTMKPKTYTVLFYVLCLFILETSIGQG